MENAWTEELRRLREENAKLERLFAMKQDDWIEVCREVDTLKEQNALLLARNTQLLADLLREMNRTEGIRQGLINMMEMADVARVNG